MNRRDFLRRSAGLAVAAAVPSVIIPDDETVRRFWRGWSVGPVHPPLNRLGDATPPPITMGGYTASPFETFDIVVDDMIPPNMALVLPNGILRGMFAVLEGTRVSSEFRRIGNTVYEAKNAGLYQYTADFDLAPLERGLIDAHEAGAVGVFRFDP